jgi:hypothetical protein
MHRTKTLSIASALLAATLAPAHAQTVAITEFLHNARGDDTGREFVELYNYGSEPLELSGWSLADEDSDLCLLGDLSIGADDFLILVAGSGGVSGAEKKALFEAEWFLGATDPRVVGIDGSWLLSNSGDEIVLRNAAGEPVWSLAYGSDGREGQAVFLSAVDYGVRAFGSKLAPGVVCEGFDNGSGDFLGYERNDSALAEDPWARESTAGNWGSPFAVLDGLPPGVLLAELSGECPGMMLLSVKNATPEGEVAILYGEKQGALTVPAGYACAGLQLGLDRTAALYGTVWADNVGRVELELPLPGLACGLWVQVLDLGSCAVSNVVQP